MNTLKRETKNMPRPNAVSASLCQQPNRKDPTKPCNGAVLAKGMCRYHYDKFRAHEVKGRTLEPKYRVGVAEMYRGSVDLYPDEVRVFKAKAAAEDRSVYSVMCDVLSDWAKSQPAYVSTDSVKALAPEMMDLALLAQDMKPGCKCGECIGCKARALVGKARK